MTSSTSSLFICFCCLAATALLPLNGQLLKVKTESTTEEDSLSTTFSPDFNYSQDFDKVFSEDGDSIPATTTPAPSPPPRNRSYGNRVRGINSSPYGTNSISSHSRPVIVKNDTGEVLSVVQNPGSVVNPTPFIPPSPTPFNGGFSSIPKRRKNSTTYVTTSTLTSLLSRLNNQTTEGSRTNLFRYLNRTREETSTPVSLSSSSRRTPSSSTGNNNLTKIIIRKRPRPVTLNDDTTDSPTTETPVTGAESSLQNRVNRIQVPDVADVPLTKVRRLKSSKSTILIDPSPSLVPEPVSHYSVSASFPSFEYNPSVAVQNGVYSYRYSDPSYFHSRVVHNDFGVSHVTYNYPEEEEEHLETTTFAPAPNGENHHVSIDASEEEYASSLPPTYQDFYSGMEDGPFGAKIPKVPDQSRLPAKVVSENSKSVVAHQEAKSGANSAVTVTVTETIIAPSSVRKEYSSIVRLSSSGVLSSPSSRLDSHPNAIPGISSNLGNSTEDNSIRESHSNEDNRILPTPALPPIPIQSSTETVLRQQESKPEGVSNDGVTEQPHQPRNPAPPPPTMPTGDHGNVNNLGIVSKEEESNVVVHPAEVPPLVDPSPSPTPGVTSKVFSSVYFTTESNPYYTTSSYSFSASTEYSYGQGDHTDHEGVHDDHGHDQEPHHGEIDNTGKQQQLRPSTTAYWDSMKSRVPSPPGPTNATHDLQPAHSTPQAETERPGTTTLTTPPPLSSSSTPGGNPDIYSDVYGNEIGDLLDQNSPTRRPNATNQRNHSSQFPAYDVHYNGNDSASGSGDGHLSLPSVPVFIQVLLDMPAASFCLNLGGFKQMIVKVYGASVNITPSQVVVYNEEHCDKYQATLNNLQFNHSLELNRTKPRIRFATTTASVIRTFSSTTRASRSKDSSDTTPPSTSTTTSTLEKPIRQRRHENSGSAKSQAHISSGYDPEVRGTSPGPDLSDEQFPTESTTLYPVFFYLTDRNGSYDRELTEAFIDHWKNKSETALPDTSMFFRKIRKIEMVTPPKIGAEANENTGVIAAITIAAVAVVGLVIVGILLLIMRHRQAQSKFAKRCTPVSLDDYSLDNISVFSSFRRKQRNRASKRSYTNAGFDDPNAPSRPLNAKGLTDILKETAKLEEEFRDLPSVNPTLEDMPAGAEPKNRYANVIPMPDTRVLLTFQDDSPNSDYINANFVRGPLSSSKAYIITQGPLEETVVDFWRMVWEQQIRVIMMLTDFSEAGVAKCAEYYPRSEAVDNSQLHGDFQITLEKRDISENCITSFLVIKDMERNLRRNVVHLWYHSWPEKGVPASPKTTIDFLTRSRKYTKEPSPVLVHCSPGTGRSGTLVACDIALKEYEAQQSVNIPRVVMMVRQDRAGAVQTKDQYLHIYSVAQSYASRHSASHMDSI